MASLTSDNVQQVSLSLREDTAASYGTAQSTSLMLVSCRQPLFLRCFYCKVMSALMVAVHSLTSSAGIYLTQQCMIQKPEGTINWAAVVNSCCYSNTKFTHTHTRDTHVCLADDTSITCYLYCKSICKSMCVRAKLITQFGMHPSLNGGDVH